MGAAPQPPRAACCSLPPFLPCFSLPARPPEEHNHVLMPALGWGVTQRAHVGHFPGRVSTTSLCRRQCWSQVSVAPRKGHGAAGGCTSAEHCERVISSIVQDAFHFHLLPFVCSAFLNPSERNCSIPLMIRNIVLFSHIHGENNLPCR